MPVRFKGVSEYSNSFKWAPSYRSAQFTPTIQQHAPEAGLRSDQMGLLMEPSFTRKRQVPHRRPEAQSLMMWWQDEEICMDDEEPAPVVKSFSDDMCLAQNKTFVKKKRVASKRYDSDRRKKSSNTQADLKTAVVSEQYEKQMGKVSKDHPQKVSSPARKNGATSPLKPTGSKMKLQDSVTQTRKLSTTTKHNTPPKRQDKHRHSDAKSGNENKQKVSPSKVQTLPLRYRPRRFHSSHQSEYQHMFRKPIKFVPSSPLISALDVVHTSSQAIPPHKSPRMLLKTEYATKFHSQSPLSKSLPANSSPASPSLKLKVKNFPTSPLHLHRSVKMKESEYANQFASRDYPTESQEQIRKNADQNKMNRDACSFDRDHTVQLHSPRNKFWELASQSSKIGAASESEIQEVVHSESNAATSGDEDDAIESIASLEKDTVNSITPMPPSFERSDLGFKPVSRRLAWSEVSNDGDATDDDVTTIESSNITITPSDSATGFEGRLPTPQLKQMGGALRTHHDLTTPCIGEALLSSPSSTHKPRAATAVTPAQTGLTPEKKNESAPPKTKLVAAMQSPKPKAVQPKPRAADSRPIKSATLPRRMEQSPRAPIRGSLRDQEFQHFGKNARPTLAYDQISIASSRSTASAEQLLGRSLQRRDFWTQK